MTEEAVDSMEHAISRLDAKQFFALLEEGHALPSPEECATLINGIMVNAGTYAEAQYHQDKELTNLLDSRIKSLQEMAPVLFTHGMDVDRDGEVGPSHMFPNDDYNVISYYVGTITEPELVRVLLKHGLCFTRLDYSDDETLRETPLKKAHEMAQHYAARPDHASNVATLHAYVEMFDDYLENHSELWRKFNNGWNPYLAERGNGLADDATICQSLCDVEEDLKLSIDHENPLSLLHAFSSIGKLNQAFAPEHWQGNELAALALIDRLYPYQQKQLLHERITLQQRIPDPQHVIKNWSAVAGLDVATELATARI
jgi:hypothetical protein